MQDVNNNHDQHEEEFYDDSDSKVDAIAAVILALVFVGVCLHWISGQ